VSAWRGGWRVGIDTGGTFTDVVAVRGEDIRTAKVSSTPPRFDDGVLNAIDRVGLRPADVEMLAHGTTVTTNAVITKSGASTGLITTRGFRDVLALRRHDSEELYDLMWDPPPPLVPRRFRLEVSERVDYAGAVIAELDDGEVEAVVDRLREEGVESLAICFLHSYANSAHERRVREIVRDHWPEAYVSLSSDLLREPQEFERTSTTVVSAYVGPVLARYVAGLLERLHGGGFAGRLMIMHSGGGLLPAESILAVPARTLASGPSAGAMAAQGLATGNARGGDSREGRELQSPRQVISLDIGGTSADIAVIRDGRALLVNEYAPEFGMPIRFPAVDLVAVGAGGGSIAWVDAAGTPRVGPQSAGAEPGPACYGRGGTRATLTDAHLVLGRLSGGTALADDLALDPELAVRAVAGFAGRVGLDLDDAALGILAIANSNMARAVRVMTIERGLDPRAFTLVPFGGAGPMHACELAEELGVRDVLVPATPGVTSALGTLLVDIVHDVARSLIAPLATLDRDPGVVADVFTALEEQATARLDGDLVPPSHRRIERSLDLRYLGQVKTLAIPVPGGRFDRATLAAARDRFLAEYERRYHYVTDEIGIELAVVRVRARGIQDRPDLVAPTSSAASAPVGQRAVRFAGGRVDSAVHDRAALGPRAAFAGPAIVEQPDTTTVVPPGWTLAVDAEGNLRLRQAAAAAPTEETATTRGDPQ
jgi:N-methylhydantoinase A